MSIRIYCIYFGGRKMAYDFETFVSTYQTLMYNEKPIVLFENHNMAFPVWGCISSNLQKELTLITLDTHADTRPPFARELTNNYSHLIGEPGKIFKKDILSKYNCFRNDFLCEDAYRLAVDYIAHDEHIQTACYFRYIDKYFIFCNLDPYEREGRQDMDRDDGFDATYYGKNDIQSLSQQDIELMCNEQYILDIDLDYFTSKNLFENQALISNLTPIIQNATCITIAKEPKYFEIEKDIDEIDYTNTDALKLLLNLINNCLS